MICPFTQEKLLLVPALNPDVALIHVQRCDAYGNAQIDGLQFMDIDLAMAANRVILTTERIVSNDQIRRAPDQTKIPFFAVDAVVELPFGCAPHECYGVYEPMIRHMEYYVGLVNKDPVERHARVPRSLRLRPGVVDGVSRSDRPRSAARRPLAQGGPLTMRSAPPAVSASRTAGDSERAAAQGRAGGVCRRRHSAAGGDARAADCGVPA